MFFKKKEKTAEQNINRAKFLFKVRLVGMYAIGAIGGGTWVYSAIESMNLYAEMNSTATVVIERAYASEEPEEAAEKVVEAEEAEEKPFDIVDFIFMKESSRGKNNYSKCEAQGKINGVGFGIDGTGKYICFNSHEEEMQAVKGWIIAKRAAGLSDNELLCLYNTGKATKTCKYIE